MKPDPELRALLDRAAAEVPVDPGAALAAIEQREDARTRRPGIAAAIAVVLVLLAGALVWRGVTDDRSFVREGAGWASGRLAIAHGKGFTYELTILDVATGRETEAELGGAPTDAAWSPDGTRLAATVELPERAGTAIVVIEPDGTVRTIQERGHAGAVGPDTIAVTWSPDGSRLAFSARTIGRGRTVSIIDVDGTDERVLDGFWADVDWSPDGRQLVLKGNPEGPDAGNLDLWLVDADGTGFRQLTDDARDEHTVSWSPDGTRILYSGLRDGAVDDIDTDLFVVDAAGGSAPVTLLGGAGFDGLPVWSPDGAWIAFASERSATPAERAAMHAGRSNHGMAIHVAAVDGSGVELVAAWEGEGAYPMAWAP